jgi:hypothetical protein
VAKKYLTPIAPPSLASDPASGVTGAIYYNTTANVLKWNSSIRYSSRLSFTRFNLF